MPYKNKQDALEYGKKYRAMCKRLKICVYCLKQDAYTIGGRSACAECAEKYAKRKKEKHYSSKESIDNRKYYRKQLRQKHIENHECVVCGAKLPNGYNYKTCNSCRAYNRIRQRKPSSFYRGEYGICWTCNKNKAIEGKKLCQECYDRQLEILKNIPKQQKHKWRNFVYGKQANKI